MKSILEFFAGYFGQLIINSLWFGITIAILTNQPKWIGVIVMGAYMIDFFLDKVLNHRRQFTLNINQPPISEGENHGT